MPRIFEEVDPTFAATCSDVTLCSNPKGFFKNLSEEVVALADTDGWLDSFEKVEDGKKVVTVMENKAVIIFYLLIPLCVRSCYCDIVQ